MNIIMISLKTFAWSFCMGLLPLMSSGIGGMRPVIAREVWARALAEHLGTRAVVKDMVCRLNLLIAMYNNVRVNVELEFEGSCVLVEEA
jgi:hypothetical protein